MTAHQIIFYILAAVILVTGLLAVTSPKIFRSAIFLLFSLLGVAGLYFWMEVDFVAAVQISVYVGGIVVLIIFSIFLTEQAGKDAAKAPAVRTIAASLAALFGIVFTYLIISRYGFTQAAEPFDFSVHKVGYAFLNVGDGGYALPFEAISILLLAAMVGCIVVAMRTKDAKAVQNKTNNNKINEDELL